MNCRRMEELIPLYVEGDLGGQGAGDVRSHLQDCDTCRALATRYQASQAWLRAAEPDFDEAFVDTIRAGVMRELTASEAAPPFVERLRQWLAPRRLAAATAALLVVFMAVLLFVYASRSRLDQQDKQQAEHHPAPAVEPAKEGMKPAPGAKQRVNDPGSRRPYRTASMLARHSTRDAGRGARPQAQLVAQQPLDAVPAVPGHASNDASKGAGTLRIELQTADPNIRIIWFAPRQTDADAPTPMGETR